MSADEVADLLREVELTGDVLVDVHTDLAARGIRIAEPDERPSSTTTPRRRRCARSS